MENKNKLHEATKSQVKTKIMCQVTLAADGQTLLLLPVHPLPPNVNLPKVGSKLPKMGKVKEAPKGAQEGIEAPRVGALWNDSWQAGDVLTFTLQAVKGGYDLAEPSVFAPAKSPKSRLIDILKRYELLPFHSPQAMAEVKSFLEKPGIDDKSLVDMAHLPFVTIDNVGSRDLDQALHISRRQGGGYVLRYALADGAYYVRPNSALFQEALVRGVTYYFPGFCLPMLPAEMSEGLVSLNPNVERRSLVFVIDLSEIGKVEKVELCRARIKSRAQLTYEGVQEYIDSPHGHQLDGQDFTESLQLLREFGELRIALSQKRGVVDYNRYEVAIHAPDKAEGSFDLLLEERCEVSRWNEQVSLLCNAEGARFLRHGDVPVEHVQPVFRVHEKPSPDAFNHLRKFINEFVKVHALDEARWLWQEEQTIADYLKALPCDGENKAKKEAIERQILITNQRSSFDAQPGRHHALAVNEYSRFTSPMREIVGIFTHKEALEMLGLEKQQGTDEEDEALRLEVIEAANKSKMRHGQITKEIFRLAVDDLFRKEMSLPFEERRTFVGTLLGMKETRLYVRLQDPPAEIKVYRDHLEQECGCQLSISDGQTVLETADGSYSLLAGQLIKLRVRGYDDRKDRWKLVPLIK